MEASGDPRFGIVDPGSDERVNMKLYFRVDGINWNSFANILIGIVVVETFALSIYFLMVLLISLLL